MIDEPRIRTEPLGGSPLSRAARGGTLPQWYRPAPADAAGWRTYAQSVASSVSPSWHDELRDAIAPHGAAATRLSRSANGQGIVITTGQQAGLFGGPLMTLIKAISARAVADTIQSATGIPVAPLFWAATDDADFEEAAVVSVPLDGGARELHLEQRAPVGTPMTRVMIDGEIAELAAILRDACGSAPHRVFLDRAIEAFRDGATIGDAYVSLLRYVLEPLEIPVLDASHPDVARAGQPLLQKALASSDAVAAAAARRTDEIVGAGFKPQVDDISGLSLVFLNADGTKRRLPMNEAKSIEHRRDTYYSATVLLPPVLERTIVPTAAYVAGPGEFAYFAQVSAVADALAVPSPLVVPRWSATIVEPRTQRILDHLRLTVEDLADPHAADNRVAREHLSSEAADALSALRRDVKADIERLRRSSDGLVPSAVLDGLTNAIEHRLARTERRLIAGVKRRETDVMRQVGTVRGSLFPHGVRQERKLAYIPFLARYGQPLLDRMLTEAKAHAKALIAERPVASVRPVDAAASV
jgi:bacillithiol biosynthesis cysteine-adding enzyme BshC